MAEVTEFWRPRTVYNAEIVVKKSRFIGHIAPVQSVEEADMELGRLRERHKAANHNCFAYTLGLGIPVERFSDDGEPNGTAGRPILEVLRKRGLRNTLIVVTRYFGGTLLGTNGLVHAYSDASVAALDGSLLLHCQQMCPIDVICDYAQYGKLEYELAQAGYTLYDKEFAADVRFRIWVSPGAAPGLEAKILDDTQGRARASVGEMTFIGLGTDGTYVFGVV